MRKQASLQRGKHPYRITDHLVALLRVIHFLTTITVISNAFSIAYLVFLYPKETHSDLPIMYVVGVILS